MRDIHISIVSHRHGIQVESLLDDLSKHDSASRIQVTVVENIPEIHKIKYHKYGYPVNILMNKKPLGFSENNNIAFFNPVDIEAAKYFFVINPDVRIPNDLFPDIISVLENDKTIGVIATQSISYDGSIQDSARVFPTPSGIIGKLFTGNKGVTAFSNSPYYTDWVAGMFMGFRQDVYKAVNGFDQGYRLYYEDVDICCRISSIGYKIMVIPDLTVIHEGKRDSRRKIKYLYWHVSSMIRFFLSDCYKEIVSSKKRTT